jgi:hypothetical protein
VGRGVGVLSWARDRTAGQVWPSRSSPRIKR